MNLTIATWFVADTAQNATHFPQVGGNSSSISFQKVYWKCIVGFFATSLAHNPGAAHRFYSNSELPTLDGFDVKAFFNKHKIEVIPLDITYRLPRNIANAWGNQFYILDIIKHFGRHPTNSKLIVLDSDCVWTSDASDIGHAIDAHGCLTYTLDEAVYSPAARINGVTRIEMQRALLRWRPDYISLDEDAGVPYHGGEIFAATHDECERLAHQTDLLWNWQLQNTSNVGFLEEAHFLSILYALNQYRSFTANAFIKRMWTTFKHRNISARDADLSIWHLPAEKKTGFDSLFELIREGSLPQDGSTLKTRLGETMGIPKRSPSKLLRDLSYKLSERALDRLNLR